MLGPILLVPEPLFYYRRFPERTDAIRVERLGGIQDASRAVTRLEEALSDAVGRSASSSEKLRLRAEILRAAYLNNSFGHHGPARRTSAAGQGRMA